MSFLMMGRDMRAMVPTELLFWGVMSIGVIAGFATAYPANVWMVKRGLKHGLMTERERTLRKKMAKMRAGPMASDEHAAHEKHTMQSDSTFAQRAALGGVSLVALLIGMAAPANWVNLLSLIHISEPT